MRTRQILLVAAAAVAAVGGLDAVWTHVATDRIRAETVSAQARCAILEAKLAASDHETASASAAQGQLGAVRQPEVERPEAGIGVARTVEKSDGPGACPGGQDTASVDLAVRCGRANDAIALRGLFRRLRLSREQIDAVLDARGLMMEGMEEMLEGARLAQETGVADPTVKEKVDRKYQEAGERLFRALGPEGMAEMKRIQKCPIATGAVESLAGQLYYTDSPLVAAQGDKLLESIASHTGAATQTGMLWTEGETDWPAVLRDAEQFLSPAQLAVLEESAELARLEKLSSRRMMELRVQPGQ